MAFQLLRRIQPVSSDDDWVEVRTKTFINWTNNQLKKTGKRVRNLQADFGDGVVLIKLLESLAPGKKMPGRYYPNPRTPIQKTQNLAIAFRFMLQVEKIPLTNIGLGDIIQQSTKPILRLIWALILHYKLQTTPTITELGQSQKKAKTLLLLWLNGVLSNKTITNLTTDWNDGINLSALINYCKPGLIPDHASLNRNNGLQNIQNAMYAAEEHLGIPRIIDPRRLVVEKPDEQTVMSYLSYFCCPNSPGQKALLEWVNQVIPDHNVSNFSSDWIDGRALGALINVISEGGFPEHQQMNAQEGLANCKRSMDAAESLLKVRKTLQPEEFTDLPFHQLARMSYVTQLYLTKQAQSQGLSLPTALIPTAPHNVEITNVHIPDEPGTGTKLMWVELDCSQAGSGVVTGEAKGEIAGTIDAEVEDIGLDQYRVRFPLVQADIYRMSVHYGDGHITGSPFSINLLPPDADRVQLLSTSTAEETGGPVALSFNVAEAGQGKLTAKASTESGDIVPVEVEENLDGTFKVLLSPQEPDVYIVDVNWGRFSVEGADKRGDPLSVAVEKDPNSDYKVSFGLPGLRTDTYKVTVLWEGKPVPGSPFQINLLPPALPEKVEIGMPLFTNIGEPVDIAIDTSSAGSGEVIASCVGEQCGRVPVKIAGPSRKPYQVSFVPPYPDIYTLSVLYDDSHIRDSPFTIDLRPGMMPIPEEPEEPEEEDILDGLLESVLDLEPSSKIPISEEPIELAPESVEEASPPGIPISEEPVEWVPESVEESLPPGIDVDPSKCKITGQENLKGLLLANQPVSLKVDAREAGKGVLEVIPQGPKGSQEPPLLEVTPNPEEPQIYDVTFVPTVHGKYTMQFLWSSYPIPDSPVEFKATDISAVPASLHGKPIGLDLDSEAKPSDLKAYAIHEDTNAQFKVKISKAQKGKLKLTFQPKEPGIYRLHVFSKDKDIRGSPFIVRYGKPPKADACKVEGIGKKYYIGEPLSFTINATEAGSGELVVRPTGPKGKKEKSEFSVNDNQDGTYRIEYTPINTGEHAFAFTWGGKTIPGCPYYVTVVERTPEIEPVSTDVYLIDRMGAPSEKQHKVQPAPEELGTSLGTALLLRITARGEEQRKAELIASATGERTGSAEVTIYRKSDSTSEVLFKPTEPDRYTIDVKLDGSDVPKCPLVASFAVAVSDPSKCLIIDLDKIPSPQQVGKDIPFRVDATAAGPGELKVSVDGPAATVDESPNLEVYPSREEPHMYHVRYVPTAPGTHNLHLKWEDEVIPGSPLSYEVNDIEEVQHGQPMGMDFSADCKIGDLDAYAIHEDTNTKHKVKIIKVQKGRFKLALQANHPGVYAIHVLLKHKEITGSPFRIRYGKQSHPENVRVTELPNQGYVDKPFTFKVDAKQAGSGELGVRGVGPTSGEKPKLAITDGKDRTFSVDYISNAPGDHQFHITWGGETVPGSPFEVPVIEPPEFEYKAAVYEEEPSLVTLTGRPLESELLPPELRGEEERKPTEMTIMVGKALRVKIRPQDEEQRKGGLVATAEGDKNGSTDVQVKQTPDGSFEVLFNPSSPDRYTIDMKINNEPVPKTPIIANYILPTIDASKCELLGIEDIPIPIKVNQEIHFQVNSREAGPGALGINVSPPHAQPQPKIEARPSKEEPRIFDVYYTPPTAGLHKLRLTWEKESIPGSPLNFVVEEEVSIEDAFTSLLEALPPKIEWKEPAVSKVGQPLELPLDITTTEQGSITAKCTGEECGEVPVEIIAESPIKYKVSFTPQLDDLYTLQVFQNDKELQGSPYEIDLRRKRTISFVEEVGQVLETVEESAPPLPYFEELPKEEEPAIVEAEPVTESRPMEELTNYVGRALVVKVRPQNEEQKEGDLVVSAIGERTGSVDATVSRTSDDKFEIVFNPTEPDRYTIEAKLNDEHIPRSPFVVNYIVPPPDPSKCKLIGLKDLPGIPEVDCEIPLKVDTRKAGDGILDVTVDGPTRDQEPPKLELKPSKHNPRVFHVNYIPTAPGSHTLNFQWSDTHIPDSPVKLVVVDMSTVETHLFGRPVGIDVDADCKVGELRAYALHEGTRTQLKVKAARVQKGKYKLTFQPKGAGLYYVHVFAKDKEVDRSPFLIRIAEPPKPEAVKVEGLTDKGYVEEPVNFTVDAREAGGGELNVRASGPGGKERGTLTVNDNKDSTYSVEYTPSSQGKHQFQITWVGKPVTGSPFPFLVKERSEEDLRVRLSLVDRMGAQSALEPPEASATTDKDVLITIKAQTEEQKKATITASATGERVGSADVQISKPSEGVFEVLFHPPGPDRYAIEAKLDDELVPSTPVIVNYTVPPTDASLIQIVGLDNIPAVLQVNREIPFKADARLAGDGKLDVVVEAPQEEKDPPNLEVNEREPYIYDVSYVPTVPGSHTLKLTWGEEAIPLNFDVSSVQLFPYGKPITMDIGTEGKAGDLESHAIHEDTGNRYKVKISKAQKGRFKLNFNPKETGLYAVHVFHKKNEIPGSPFHVRYDKPSHPENVRVTELPDQGYVDKPFTFKVDAKQAGSGELGVRGVGPTSGEKPKLAITDGKDRTFSVDYIPNAPGDHQFHITWGGETVPGSPFEVPVIEPPEFEYKAAVYEEEPSLVTLTGRPLESELLPPELRGEEERKPTEMTIMVGKALRVKIRPHDEEQRKGGLVATAEGDKNGSTDVQVKQTPDGSFEVLFNPSSPDRYTIDMKINNEPVPKTPIIANYILPPIDASKCKLLRIEDIPIPIKVNQEIYFQVDSREAGPGALGINVSPPHAQPQPKIEARPSKEEPRIFDVYYTPPTAGLHKLRLTWEKESIPGSPLNFVVEEEVSIEDAFASLLEALPPKIEWKEPAVSKVGQPLELPLDITTTEQGSITAKCTGEECGEVPVEIIAESPTKYKVSFTPQLDDLYTLQVFQNDKELQGSPYEIDLRRKRTISFVEEVGQVLETVEESAPPLPYFEEPPKEEEPAIVEAEPVTESRPMEELTNYVGRALVVKVRPQNEEQKEGDLVVSAIGERTGSVDAKVSRTSDDKFEIVFNPTEPDRYTIEAKLNDEHIPRSPFVVNYIVPPPDPSKCKLIGLKDLPGIPEVDCEILLKVDTRMAGDGILDVTVDGPTRDQEPPKLEVKPSEDDPRVFHVNYIPTAPGSHTLNFQWSDTHIPDSPVKLVVVDMSTVETHLFGRPVGIDVDADCKVGELRAYALHEGTRTQLKVKAARVQKGKYKLTFQPKGAGLYYVHVFAKDKEVDRSPFLIRIAEPPKPEAVKVEGLTDKGYVEELINFTVDAREAGGGELNVRASGPGGKERGTLTVNDNKDSTYSVEYTPSSQGKHQLQITWAGKPVTDSPFPFLVKERSEEDLRVRLSLVDRTGAQSALEPPEASATTDKDVLITIKAQTEEQKKATITASATGERVGSADVQISKPSEGVFEVLFHPPGPDRYAIEAKLDDELVPLTLVIVNYTVPPTDASLIQIVGLDNIPAVLQVNREIPFKADARLAGDGRLDVVVEAPQEEKDPPNLEVNEREPYIYDVSYVPTVPGSHTLKLTWGEEAIPLNFDVSSVQLFPYGKPIAMDIGTEGKAGDLESHAIHEDTGNRYKVKISKAQKGRFKLNFNPKETGLYAVHVFHKKNEIPGSPFHVRYDKPSHPENVRVTELPDQGYVDKPFTFKVDAKQAGSGEFGVRGVGPTSGEKPKLAITDGKDRTFSVDYIPNAPGDHQFHITWGGETVPGSPFEIPVIESPEFEYKAAVYEEEPSLVTLTGRPLESELLPPELRGEEEERKPTEMTIMVGKALRVKIRPHDEEQRKGGLVATAEGDRNGSTDVQVKQTPDGSFEVLFNPSSPDRYTIDMKINNEPVPNTPIIANYILPPIDASKCKLLRIEDIPIPIKVNQEIYFQVDSREAGPGALGINVSPPHAQPQPKIEARPSKEEPRIFDVYYTPPTAGLHKLRLTWEKESIPGSPLNFVVEEEVSIEDAFASLLEALPPKIEWKEPAVSKVGQPLELPLDITTTEQGSITAKCTGEECGEVPVEIIAESPTKYKVSFTPQLDDLYTLQVFQNDKELQGSPYEIDLRRKRTISFVEEVGQVLETVEESAPPLPYFEELPKEEEPAIVEAEPVTESRPMEELTNYVGRALVVKVRPQNEEQKEGDLVVSAIGERTGSVDATVSRTSDDKFEIVFNPTEPDRYTIEAKLNDEHIPRSPFVVNYIVPPPDPSKCKLIGLKDLPGIPEVDCEIPLKVDTRKAGDGILDVTVDGPTRDQEPSKLEVKPSKHNPRVFHVNYIPTAPGSHTLNFQWSDTHIPDSPVKLVVVDMSTVETHLFGRPVGIDVDADCKVGELRAYALHEGTRTQLKVKAARIQKGKYKLTFQPKGAGLYYVHVFAKDKEVNRSPFLIRIAEPPKPEAVKVEGLTDKGYVEEPVNFTVDAREAGGGELNVRASGPGGKERGTLTVNDNKDSTYSVEYTPSSQGKHQFQITWVGKPVTGSPFPFLVKERSEEDLRVRLSLVDRMGAQSALEPPEASATTDKDVLITIKAQTEEQKKATITASATGERVGSADVQISKPSEGVFEVLFHPPGPDRYAIEAKLDDELVPSTPVIVNYTVPPTDASLIQIVGLDNIPAVLQVNREIPFKADARLAGDGKLDVVVEAPQEEKDPPNLEVNEREPYIYDVSYVPTVPGSHTLKLTWGEEAIPLNFDVSSVQLFPYGKPITMDIGTEGKAGDLESHAIHEDTGNRYKVKISKAQKGRFKLNFNPKETGLYAVHVFHKKNEIPGSPFHVRYDKPSHPENVRVTELPDQGYVDKPFTFKVDAKQAGSGELGVRGVGPTSGEKPKLAITDGKDRTFSVDYIPNAPGDHQFHITWGGETVPGSPFEVPVIEPPEFEYKAAVYEEEPSLVTLTGRPLESELLPPELRGEEERKPMEMTIMVGKALRVKIRPQDEEQRKGGLVATAEGDKNGSTDVQVKQTPDGSFEVLFNPSSPDRYTIDMKINNEPVPKTPIIANYILPPIDASKCKLLRIEDIPIPIKVNQEIYFQVDSREAGPGALGINVSPPHAQPQPKIEARPSKEEPRIFDVYYTPPTAGLHKLRLTWEKESIPGSPLNFMVEEEVSIEDAFASLLEALPPKIEWKEPAVSKVGQPLELPLDITTTEQGSITAKCTGEECGEVPVEIIAESPTNYKVSFTPQLDDLYTLQVFQNDKELQGSPYEIDLRRKRTISFVEEVGQVLETVEESAPPLPYFEEPPKEEEPAIVEAEPVTESRPMEELTNYVGRALVVKVRPQNEEQKEGDLVVSAIGERTGSVDAKVSRTSDDKFEIVFNPTEPDRYTIEAKLNDEHIPRSPFVVNYIVPPPDPSKCKLIGLKDLPGIPEVDCEIPLKVDTRMAGDGILDVTVDGPTRDQEPPKLELKPSEDDPRVFHVNYIPTAPGSHTLNFQWSDTHIPDSPVKLVVVDMSTVETHLFGRPVGIDVDADCKVGELRAYALHEGTRTQLKVKAARVQKGKYKLTFQPKGAGLYYVHVFAKDKEVDRSPFLIRIAEPPKPEAVKVEGLTDKGYVEEPVNFTVDAREAGGGELNVRASGPGGKERGTLTVNDNKDSTYSVEYTPSSQGKHQFQITWAGKPVTGSPFPFLVKERSEEDLRVRLSLVDRTGAQSALEPPEASATTDKDVLITIKAQTEEQKKATITASATGERVGSADVQISKPSEGVFEVLFHPPGPDRYAIEAKLDDELVPSTPVIVNYTVPPTDASLIQIVGLDNIPAVLQVNREIPFKADARLAGDGKLDVVVEAPQEEKDPPNLEVNEREPYIYDVSYVPTVPGSHTLKLTWGEEAIPLNFDVSSVQLFPYGKPITMDIGTEGKAGDLESHAIHEDTGNRYKVKISKVQKGRFKLNFNPKEPGLYAVHVFHKKNEIPGSPFHVRYSMPTNPQACVVRGLSDASYIFEPLNFVVDASDAGTGELGFKVSGPAEIRDDQFTVTNGKDSGVYTATFVPNTLGEHHFNFTWASKAIPGSPFSVNVLKRKPLIKKPLVGNVNLVQLDQPVVILVTNIGKDEDENFLTAHATGLEAGAADIAVEKIDEGTSLVKFTAKTPDDYTIEVKLNNEHIEGSPFYIKAVEKVSIAKGFVHPEGVCHSDVEAGQLVNLIAQVQDAKAASDLAVTTEGPEGTYETSVNNEVEGTFGFSFLPTVPGDYLVHVKAQDGEEVPGSPYKITVFEKEPEALKCFLPEADLLLIEKPLQAGKQISFHVNTREAGEGRLRVTSEGPERAEITVTDQQDGTQYCQFAPQVAGSYQLSAVWDNHHIQGSPFSLLVKEPPTVIGLSLENEKFQIGIPHHFKVDCGEVGDGILEVASTPSSAADIRVTPTVEASSYVCLVLPKEVGEHEIAVRYNGVHIRGSPFQVSFTPTSVANLGFSFVAEGMETQDVTATVESKATEEQIPSAISELFGGKYNLEFTPSQGLEYMVTIKCVVKLKTEEQQVRGSPFKLAFAEDASQCFARGEGLECAEVGKWNKFSVNTENAGQGELKVEIEGGGENPEVVISATSEHEYEVSYFPLNAGSYKLSISWGGKHIPGSPLEIQCTKQGDSTTAAKFILSQMPVQVQHGMPIEFVVNAQGVSGGGQLVVRAERESGQSITGNVKEDSAGSYNCSIEATEPGSYSIDLYWNESKIFESPVIVNVLPPPAPENVRVYGPGVENGYVGQEGNFTIDTTSAGSGTLAVQVEGPQGGFKINLDRHPENNRVIIAKYDPTHSGEYSIQITWSGVQVPGSPFQVAITEPEDK